MHREAYAKQQWQPHNLVPEYLQELESRVGENLDTEQRAAAVELLAEFQDVFAGNDIDLGNLCRCCTSH